MPLGFAPERRHDPAASAAPASPATLFTCPLCGARFSHGGRACGSCPMNVGCDVVRCPSCGYGFPRTSRLVELARRVVTLAGRLLRSRGEADVLEPPLADEFVLESDVPSNDPLILPLSDLAPGRHARVVSVVPREPALLVRLSGLGLVNGATLLLHQQRPATVIALGETTVALDREVARWIYVREEGR